MSQVRAAVYARVSSAEQRDKHTIESQLLVLRRYVAAQGWTLAGEYVDDGRSAKTGKLEARDGFARLVADTERGLFDVVVILDVNRLTRTSDMAERAEILGPFQRSNVQIVTPSGGALDLRTFFGELWVTMQALVAAEDNRKRGEAVKAGKLRAIAEGRKPAGPTPYGLTYSRAAGTWGIDDARATIAIEICARIRAGDSCFAIASDLHERSVPTSRGLWSRERVYKIATSRHLVGEWWADKARKLVVPVPALLTESEWQATQDALIDAGKRGLRRTRHIYLLEGLAVCGACGDPIAIRSANLGPSRGGTYVNPAAYVCRARKNAAELESRGLPRCTAPVLRVADADARVWDVVARTIQSDDIAERVHRMFAARDANRRDWAGDVATSRAHLERLVKHEASMLARFRRSMIGEPALDLELAAIARERGAVQRQLATAQQAAARDGAAQVSADEVLAELRELVYSSAPEARQRVVRAVVEQGAVVRGSAIYLTLRVASAASGAAFGEGARGVLAQHAGSISILRDAVRIRLVA